MKLNGVFITALSVSSVFILGFSSLSRAYGQHETIIPASQRPFSISPEGRDLVVENNELRLLKEAAIPEATTRADLTLSTFLGQSQYRNQAVNMGQTVVNYDFDPLFLVGVNFKKDLVERYFGAGTQVEYQTFENDRTSLHILPFTAFVFGRTPQWRRFHLRALTEVGYSWAYVRQVGTAGHTGGLAGRAAFWQAGLEVPFHLRRDEEWALGLFYSERRLAEGDFDLSSESVKLQGSLSL